MSTALRRAGAWLCGTTLAVVAVVAARNEPETATAVAILRRMRRQDLPHLSFLRRRACCDGGGWRGQEWTRGCPGSRADSLAAEAVMAEAPLRLS